MLKSKTMSLSPWCYGIRLVKLYGVLRLVGFVLAFPEKQFRHHGKEGR